LASSVFYKSSVDKDLRKLDKPVARKITQQLEPALSENPDVGEPLSGEFRGLFKYRVGDYRVVYAKVPGGVLVLRIRHRRDVYR
jgi:mRNA interferase RelE/StbE